MKFIDWSLPKPIFRPGEWPQADLGADSTWLIPLHLACLTGGPLRRHIMRIQEFGFFVWRVDLEFFRASSSGAQSDIHWYEAEKWLTRKPPQGWVIDNGTLTELRTLFPHIEVNDADVLAGNVLGGLAASPSAFAWIEAVSPDVRAILGETRLNELLAKYREQLPEVDRRPFDGLRLFAGFLRQEGCLEAAVAFDRDWSRLACLFSVHDELKDRNQLIPGELMLNPTAQIVRSTNPDGSAHVVAYVRDFAVVREVVLDWREAAVIEVLSESFRMQEDALVEALDLAAGEGELAKLVRLKGETRFLDAIEVLREKSVLLQGS